jgi:hypothetical protein
MSFQSSSNLICLCDAGFWPNLASYECRSIITFINQGYTSIISALASHTLPCGTSWGTTSFAPASACNVSVSAHKTKFSVSCPCNAKDERFRSTQKAWSYGSCGPVKAGATLFTIKQPTRCLEFVVDFGIQREMMAAWCQLVGEDTARMLFPAPRFTNACLDPVCWR